MLNQAMRAAGAVICTMFITSSSVAIAEVVDFKDDLFAPATQTLSKPDQFKKAGPYKIGVVLPGLFTPWLVQEYEEIRYEASKHKDIAQLYIVSSDGNAEKNAADIEDLLTKGVDALVLSPVSVTSANAQIERAAAKGIPVVTFSTNSTSDKVVSAVTEADEPYGKFLVDFLVKQLDGKGSIWAIRGAAGNSVDVDRYKGAQTALKGTDIKITAEGFGNWDYAKGKQLCENYLLSGTPVDGVYAGGGMSRGCIDAFEEVGKPLVPITGDNDNGFLRAAKKSKSVFIGETYLPSQGPVALRIALGLLDGKQAYSVYNARPLAITTANLDKFYRPDLNDSFYPPSGLPEETLTKMFGKK
jgi:ribose transport system substrate-binding protein